MPTPTGTPIDPPVVLDGGFLDFGYLCINVAYITAFYHDEKWWGFRDSNPTPICRITLLGLDHSITIKATRDQMIDLIREARRKGETND